MAYHWFDITPVMATILAVWPTNHVLAELLSCHGSYENVTNPLSLMLIDVALVVLAFLLSIPAITGYFARCYDRSFWLWFIIACFLPVVAQVMLALLCYRSAKKEERRPSLFISRYEDQQMHQQISEVLHQTPEGKNIF